MKTYQIVIPVSAPEGFTEDYVETLVRRALSIGLSAQQNLDPYRFQEKQAAWDSMRLITHIG